MRAGIGAACESLNTNIIMPKNKTRARLPKEPSVLESTLLSQIKREKLPTPVQHYRFCKNRKWEFDFCYPDLMISFECEGGIWRAGGGAHSSGKAILRDIEKYNQATLLGWRVFRLHTGMVYQINWGKFREMTEGVDLIRSVLASPL